jgi:hypothetical protein
VEVEVFWLVKEPKPMDERQQRRTQPSASRAQLSTTDLAISCESFRAFPKNTLKGFATLVVLPLGLRIRDCPYHQRDDSAWVSFPARPYEKDGKTVYAVILELTSVEARTRFQRAAVPAVERYIAQHQGDEVTDEPF